MAPGTLFAQCGYRNGMSPRKTTVLIVTCALSATGAIAAGAIVLYEAAHPFATRDPWKAWIVYCLPYLLFAASAWPWRRRVWTTLVALSIATGLIAIVTTAACYQDMDTVLFISESRAAGRHGMSCGPLLSFFVLPLSYGISLAAFAEGLGLLPMRRAEP